MNEVAGLNGHLSPTLTFYPANGLNPYTGYGRVELGLARELQGLGIRLENWPSTSPVLVVGNAEWLNVPHLAGCEMYLYTMSESDRVSAEWVAIINEKAAGVFVPCESLVDVYRDSGVTVPVYDVGLGMDLFTDDLIRRPMKRDPGEPFTFLTYSLGDQRKGAELTIMTFLQTFGGDDRFRLVVKARDGWTNSWLAGLDEPQIEVVGGVQTNAAWADLLGSADCFVFPSKGEGFGMPPREATLAGTPTIATAWLGMADVGQWGIPLAVGRMQRCTFDRYGANADGAMWAFPDVDDLKAKMAWVVDHYDEALTIARHGREWLWMTCRWQSVAQIIMERIYGSPNG